MNEEQYRKLTWPFVRHPKRTHALLACNRALTVLFYLLYPLLIILLAFFESTLLAREILTSAIGFVCVSVFRRIYNAPRPYEQLDIKPLVHKDTHGKSFPSRHVFSSCMIALCWLRWCVPAGIVLLVLTLFMAWVRVVGGVHFPRDVLAGLLIALAFGFVGLWLIP